MYTTEKYIEDTLSLINSLVVKFIDLAIKINEEILVKNELPVPEDKHEWKYYMNMSGIKHFSNNDIYVYVKEENSEMLLTKDLLATYNITRSELIKQDLTYKELLVKYPDDESYIKGMLFPVDIDTAIAADDGDILNYNSNLVENQELDIIRKLSLHIKGYLYRWHIRDYTIVDELYIPAMLTTIYNSLPAKLMNIRLDNIGTNKVCSYHMNNFFGSNMNIEKEASLLNNKSRMWLYNNLKYIMHHTGENKTLKVLIDNVLTPNNIGIGEYVIVTEDAKLITTDIQDTNKAISVTKKSFITKPLNDLYVIDNENIISGASLIDTEMLTNVTLDTKIMVDRTKYYSKLLDEKLKYLNSPEEKTKILDLNSYKLFIMHNVDLLAVLLDNWVYYTINKNMFKNNINFKDPNTNILYNITPEIGLYIFMKMLLFRTNMTTYQLDFMRYTNIINSNITIDDMLEGLAVSEDMIDIAIDIKSKIPTPPNFIKTNIDFNFYLNSVISFYEYINIITSNVVNPLISANIKIMVDRIFLKGKQDLKIDDVSLNVDQILMNNNININITDNYDVELTIVELVKSFTGVNIDKYAEIREFSNNLIMLIDKLTSYTTQVVQYVDTEKTLTSPYNTLAVNNTSKGFITILDGEIVRTLEYEEVDILPRGNNFISKYAVFHEFNNISVTVEDITPTGIAYADEIDHSIAYETKPIATVDIHNIYPT